MAGNHHNGRTNTRLSDAIRLNGETSINEIVPESTKFNDNETSEEPITVSASVSSSSSAMAETSTYFESVREQLERLGDPEEDFYGFGPDDVAEEELLLDPIEDLVVQYMASNEFINSRRDFSKQFQDESMDDEDDAEPAAEHTVATRPSSRTSDEGSSHGLAVKDVTTNEAFKKPFELGWIREFVYRAVPDPKISRNQGEVYYHTPSGKKLRSSRELKPYLSGGLTLENFTFSKVSLGVNDPSKEIIREAKLVNKRSSSVGTADALTPHVLGKRQPKRKVPKGASPPPEKSNIKAVNNRLNITNQRLSESRKTLSAVDIPGTSKGKLESGMLPPAWGGGPKRKSNKKKEDSVPSSYESATPPDQAESSSRQLVKNMLSKTPVPVPVMHQTQESVFEPQAGPSTGPSTGPSPGTTYTVPVQIFRCNRDPGGVTFVNEISLGVRLFKEIFKYLKVQDLLRCSRVNTLFNHIAMSPSLWKIVRLKNSAIVNIPAMCNTLIRLQTEKLDMKKALLHMPNIDNMWTEFSQNIGNVTSLLELALCRCPSRVVENIYQTNAGLRYFNAMAIHDEHLNLQGIQNMRYLRELRLRSVNGVRIETLGPLKELAGTLTFLNLTSVRGLGVIDCDVIGDLINLVNLEIGECCELPPNFGTETLSKLTSLKRVRFEKGLADVPTDNLLQAVSSMPKIEQLELINFDIKPRFDESLAMCANIKRLLIIPTYISQSATTNHLVLAGVYLLKDTLTSFMWAVTNELLRVTDLFVDQCGKNDSPGTPGPSNAPTIPKQPKPGENIPVLKPVPGYIYNPPLDPATSQVEIVPIKQLYKVLNDNLTNTTINIIKIPFSGTWRQYIPESVQC